MHFRPPMTQTDLAKKRISSGCEEAAAAPTPAPATKRRDAVRLALLLVLLVGGVLVMRFTPLGDQLTAAGVAARVRALRGQPGIGALYVLGYSIAGSIGLPISPFTLAGGAIFGFWKGTLLAALAEAIAGAGGYWIARWLGKGTFAGLLRRSPMLNEMACERPLLPLFRLRLIPVVPFSAISFAAGAIGVPFWPYFVATAVGSIPSTVVFAYFSDSLLSGAESARHTAILRLAIATLLLVGLSFLPTLMQRRSARKARLARRGDAATPDEALTTGD